MARNFCRMLWWICTTQLKVIQNVQLHTHACLHVQNSHFCCLKTISVFDLKLFLRNFILGSINITYTKTVILDPKTIKIVWVCRSLIGHKSKIMIWLFWRSPGLRRPAFREYFHLMSSWKKLPCINKKSRIVVASELDFD